MTESHDHDDNTVEESGPNTPRRYMGIMPEHEVLAGLGADRRWRIFSTEIEDYPPSDDLEENAIKGSVTYTLVQRNLGQNFGKVRLWPCPCCGTMCKPKEYEERSYTHLRNERGYQVRIVARIPKLKCPCGKVRQVETPWARPRVSYTVALEEEVMRLLVHNPVTAVSKTVGLPTWVISDIADHRITGAVGRMDLSNVSMIYVDETSFRKGQDYVTVVCDQDKRLIFMCEGRGADTMRVFADVLIDRGLDPTMIKRVSCDLGLGYPAGVREFINPDARITYDRFHVAKLAGEAVDRVRKRIFSNWPPVKGLRWLLVKHQDDLSRADRSTIAAVSRFAPELGRAYMLKEALSHMYEYQCRENAVAFLRLWYEDIEHSGIPELMKLAETIRSREEGILEWFEGRVNNGFAEGMNSLIQTTKRIARGYRSVRNFINMCFLQNGHIRIEF